MENEVPALPPTEKEDLTAPRKESPRLTKKLLSRLRDRMPWFTTGQLKILVLLEDLKRNEIFLEFVKSLRHRYGIKLKKLPLSQRTRLVTDEWGFRVQLTKKQKTEITKEISAFCRPNGLNDHPDMHRAIRQFVFYGKFSMPGPDFDLCKIRAMGNRHTNILNDREMADLKYYPVAILISPYASQRDVIDFVKEHPFLASFQEYFQKAKNSIGKTRLKDPSKRGLYDFIWKHRNMKHASTRDASLQKLIEEKFGLWLEREHINEIIRIERERRGEV